MQMCTVEGVVKILFPIMLGKWNIHRTEQNTVRHSREHQLRPNLQR